MKKILFLALAISVIGPCFAQKKSKKTNKKQEVSMSEKFNTFEDSVSYIVGFNIARNLKQDGLAFDIEKVALGLKEGYAGENGRYSEEEMQSVMIEWQKRAEAEQNKAMSGVIEENKQIGREFLENNKKEEGVVETASGLQYKVVKMGDGAKPLASDKVLVHYTGKLLDGTVFDSSVERGEPISFPLNGVIAGWTEGVQLMPVGSTFIFYIPSDLAYGDRGAGGVIKGGATLIFEVELLNIEK